ncbi:MAG: hypothetical protein GZ094_04790 [Mariniphaga sp.]|nr:hypothetical protein [Mariniphaga sp.]
MTSQSETDEICCQKFDPKPWDDQFFEWKDKKFIRDSVFTIFYMPVSFGKAMVRLNKAVTTAGAEVPDWLCLSDHTSKWNMDLYLAVDKEIPGAENTSLTGKYFCKVYEGPFSDTGKWSEDFKNQLKTKGLAGKKMFTWYTTCPKCAKKYGKNYVAMMAQVDQ